MGQKVWRGNSKWIVIIYEEKDGLYDPISNKIRQVIRKEIRKIRVRESQ